MGIYTADTRAPVTPDCYLAPYPVAHDLQPCFASEYVKLDDDQPDQEEIEDYGDESTATVDAHLETHIEAPLDSIDVAPIIDSIATPASQQDSHIDSISAAQRRVHSRNPPSCNIYFLEMLMYVASGILLIFMMEQLIRLGTRLQLRV